MTYIRETHEIDHGKVLADNNTELIWGWETPAGRLRVLRRFEFIAQGVQMKAGMRVLEVGCGTGLFTEMFSRTGAQILAVDISPELLAKARARGLPEDKVRFMEKPFEDCDVDGPFDAIIGSSVLHHLDVKAALSRIYTLLKPGGIMSFAEPNMLNPQVFAERKFRSLPCFWYVSPDETAFVRWSFRTLLLKAGFEKVEIMPFDWLHPATPASLINAVRSLGRVLEIMPVIREFAGSLYIKGRRP